MHSLPVVLLSSARSLIQAAAVSLLVFAQAQAQTASAPVPAASAEVQARPTQTTQHIRVEDASNRIDEVRVGSETKSINVQPKGGMPGYQVAPATGGRSWKVLGF